MGVLGEECLHQGFIVKVAVDSWILLADFCGTVFHDLVEDVPFYLLFYPRPILSIRCRSTLLFYFVRTVCIRQSAHAEDFC